MGQCTVIQTKARSERGQTLIEMILILPFFLLLIMVLAELGIYFYRSNQIENVAQTVGRMVARRATFGETQAYIQKTLNTINPKLSVRNSDGAEIVSWSSDQQLELRITATVNPVFPVKALNVFTPGSDFFPATFTLQSVKTVFVE